MARAEAQAAAVRVPLGDGGELARRPGDGEDRLAGTGRHAEAAGEGARRAGDVGGREPSLGDRRRERRSSLEDGTIGGGVAEQREQRRCAWVAFQEERVAEAGDRIAPAKARVEGRVGVSRRGEVVDGASTASEAAPRRAAADRREPG